MDDPIRQSRTEVVRKKISNSLTGHAKTGEVMLKSMVMAMGASLFAAPYLHHLLSLSVTLADPMSGMGLYGFLLMELFLLFVLSLLCSMAGFSFAERRGLPGLGVWPAFVKDLPLLFIMGLVFITLSIFLFDRRFQEISPSSYPQDLFYLAMFPFKGAFTDEVILRLGLVTIGAGLFRHRAAGVVFAALLALCFSMKYFQFTGIDMNVTSIILPHIFLTLLINVFLGYLFVTRGLFYAMGMNFILKLKYVVIACAL
ncbi:hypothetical protein OAC89_04590 [Deltaproteobacteria bacterium]|nr:hypothetical protein [Deltaproteobacteria bacterium]